MVWQFPLINCSGIPVKNHPGSFGHKRKHDRHTGVDLYCSDKDDVYAVEDGLVTSVKDFTGLKTGTPWWNETQCVMIKGRSGVVNYGEIKPCVSKGQKVQKGDRIGYVVAVLPLDKLRKDIPGHSVAMLHIELYNHDVTDFIEKWEHDCECPVGLLNPTHNLINSLETLQLLEIQNGIQTH